MTAQVILVDGRKVQLGRRIGKGGEGEVFTVDHDESLAVKLYTGSDRSARQPKIEAMVQVGLANRAPLVAFPLSVARTRDGTFAGFVMKLVANHKPLHELYAPGPRKQHFPHADYRFLVRTAANISRAIASVHKSGCVIGDINHSGILVSHKALVALIDADSFQVTAGKQNYLCRVGVPEYTPPELQGRPLGQIVRTPNHDAFGLAVVVFQLLFMGRHPFVGTVRQGEIPPLHDAIRDYRFVYTDDHDVGMDQPPGTPALSDFPSAVASAFEAAFARSTADKRPAADSWIQLLDDLERSLVQCGDNALHYAPRDASACPWCEMEHELGTFLFVPYVPQVGITIGPFDPGAAGFNLQLVWSRIESLKFPTRAEVQPRLSKSAPSPSAEARSARLRTQASSVAPRVIAGAIAILILFVAPAVWIVWLPLGLWALFSSSGDGSSIDGTPFRKRYQEAEELWSRELENWFRRCGLDDYETLYKELRESHDAYKSLAALEQSQVAAYQGERRSRQLHTYLDGFDIEHARIRGIGPAKLAALSSYGIDTAADVSEPKLLQVPGFGSATIQPLLDWRAGLERRFVYRPVNSEADAQEVAKIRAGIQSKASMLRRKLLAGSQNLSDLLARTKKAIELEDPVLGRAHKYREQAKCDLEFLKLTATAPTYGGTTVRSAGTTSSTRSQSGGSTPSCPRCGSTMVRRTARRGRWAGHSFWGCSRYPRCKGTRN